MALCGLTTGSVATASENESVRVSSRFAFGSPMLTNTHKSAIEKAVTAHGTDATFTVIAEAGKLPGVSDSQELVLGSVQQDLWPPGSTGLHLSSTIKTHGSSTSAMAYRTTTVRAAPTTFGQFGLFDS